MNQAMHSRNLATPLWQRLTVVAALLLLLSACGGGVETSATPGGGGNNNVVGSYTGPAPATSDVQAFKLNVWDNLVAVNRCGSCHGTGGQPPLFVRGDDVNLAYAAANPLVDLEQPALSRLATKVTEGHHCWLGSDAACGDVIAAYISAWAGGEGGGGRLIQLVAPPLRDPGASKAFPPDSGLFSTTVWPVLTAHCADCHAASAPTPQAPFFASGDVESSYDAARARIDLDTPANSRLVVRLRGFHNCWTNNCDADAAVVEDAIRAMADQIPATEVDAQLVYSKALRLTDGVVASGGSRHENNMIALYEFKTGEGNIAYDTSGIEPALNLTLSGNYGWVGGWGVEFNGGKAQGTTNASRKLYNLIRATGEYSVEAWTVPGNVVQDGPARIVSYSGGTGARNFTMGQTEYNYDFLHRSSSTDGNGEPMLSTDDADQRLQATLQHVVMTFDPANGRRIYVNGIHTGDLDPVAGGTLQDWDDSFALVFGNEASSDRPWAGALRLVAIHNRALSPEQIVQNFAAGVGEKFYLLFGLGDLVDVPQSYILFEVSRFDNYSYLFNSPTFISLDPEAQPSGLLIAGMRIGINGKEAQLGQSFSPMQTEVSSALYTASGQLLSAGGAVIPLELGPDLDEFFLTFERLGSHSNVATPPAFILPGAPPILEPVSDIGLRTFDRIHHTMAVVTDVSPSQGDVRNTFETVKQQLPTVENIEGFLSAHQMAVSQVAIEYCNALVENRGQTPRTAYFPGFDFDAPPSSAFSGAANRNLVIDPLLARMMGIGLNSQPDPAEVRAELNGLVDRLLGCSSCDTDAQRTRSIVKASCAAVLGSAVTLLQ
jgi:mono/diheme cytochrome c family protein